MAKSATLINRTQTPTSILSAPLNDTKSDSPTLHLWAFDRLAVPAMSAECERIFSSAARSEIVYMNG